MVGILRKYLFIIYIKKEIYKILVNRGLIVALRARKL